MTVTGNKLLAFLSFLAIASIIMVFVSSPAFANHKNDDDNDKDKQNIILNLPSGGTNIINNNKNTNKNENKNEVNITNSSQPVRIAAVPRTLPETGAQLAPIFALLAAIPLGLKLRRYH